MKRLSVKLALSVIIAGGLVTGVVLARRYMRGRAATPSTWRSLDQPVRDTSAEEYAVYSSIIDAIHHEDRLQVFVIRDHTAPCGRSDEWCAVKQIKNRLPGVQPETLDDYVKQNEQPVALAQSFNLPRPAVLLSDQSVSELLITTRVKVDFSSLPVRKIQWGEFYQRYPLAPGLISLSRVGFNSRMDQALVYEEIVGNTDGTWGRYLVLRKQSGKWLIEGKIESYFPAALPPSAQHGEWGTLKGRILDAKAEGLDEVQLSLLICGWDIGNLRQALQRDTVMLADVIDKKTFPDTYGLRTWYRFRIVDTLSEKPMPKYPTYSNYPDPPAEMMPLQENEFVMVETNGQMVIDGVHVTQFSNTVRYSVGGTYLIFLHLDPAKRVAVRSGTEPTGVFLVGKDGTFKAYTDGPHPLRDALEKQYGNSIENFRRALKAMTKRPKTRSADRGARRGSTAGVVDAPDAGII